MNHLLRTGALVALLGSAVAANALTLHFQSSGMGGLSAGYVANSTLLFAQNDVLTLPDTTVTSSTFQALALGVSKGAGIPAIPGSYTFAGSGSLLLTTGSVSFNIVNGFGAPTTGGFTSNTGSLVSFYGGTGIFAGLQGTGVVSFNTTKLGTVSGYDYGDETTNFDATFEAVPEPASMAVLGLGAAAMLRRRKRA